MINADDSNTTRHVPNRAGEAEIREQLISNGQQL